MCLQMEKVQFGWFTNYHGTVFVTSLDPNVLQRIWNAAQNQSGQQFMVETGRDLQEYLGSKNLFVSKIISWDEINPHLLLAYRSFSKLAALVRRAFDAYNADQEQAAPAPVPLSSFEPAPGPVPGLRRSPTGEPPAQRQRRSARTPGPTATTRPTLEQSSSLDSTASATATTGKYDMDEFDFVGRLGDHCFDATWRGSHVVMKYSKRLESEIIHEVGSLSGLSFCKACSPWVGSLSVLSIRMMHSPWHGWVVASCSTRLFLETSHRAGQAGWAMSVGCAGFQARPCSRQTSSFSIPAATS